MNNLSQRIRDLVARKIKHTWIYRNLHSGSVHFTDKAVKDSNEYEYMNHFIEHHEYEKLEQLSSALAEVVQSLEIEMGDGGTRQAYETLAQLESVISELESK